MPLGLGAPEAIAVLILCVPIVLIAARSYRRLPARRRMLTTGMRVFIMALLGLAFAGLRLNRPTEAIATIFLVDQSASVPSESRRKAVAFINEAVQAAKPRDRYALLPFGREPIVASGLTNDPATMESRVETDGSATNIAEAVSVGLAMLPDTMVPRLVLLSDGKETHDAAAALSGLVRWQEATIDTVALPSGRGLDAAVTTVDTPPLVEPKSPTEIRVEYQSNAVTSGTLRVFRNGQLWREEEVRIPKGSVVRRFKDRAPEDGTVTYRAELDAVGESRPQNNIALGMTRVSAPPSIWIADGDGYGSRMARILKRRNLSTVVVSSAQLPETPAGYANTRSVVLNNIRADAMTLAQQQALATAVSDFGVGLVMTGGRDSFGPGGWRHTPVEDVLPVTMESNRPREAAVAIVLIVDVSGSMATDVDGYPRITYAREAAREAFKVAEDDTQIGLISFSDEARVVIPLGPRPANIEQLDPLLDKLEPIGGTRGQQAFRDALGMLSQSRATARHIILLTDGVLGDQGLVMGLIPTLNGSNVTVSTVGAGADVNEEFLSSLAKRCEGVFYPYTRAADLPAFLAEDAIQVQREPLVPGPVISLSRTPGAATRNVAWGSAPPLDGMVSTTLKDGAELHSNNSEEDPVVASWRSGLATTAILTTDLGGELAAPWNNWPDQTRLWESLVRATLPPPNPAQFDAALSLDGDIAVITADAVTDRGSFINGLELSATVQSTEGGVVTAELRQVGPGQYEARVPVDGSGIFTALIRERGASGGRRWASAVRAYPLEFAPDSQVNDLLETLSQETGGQTLTNPADAFRPPAKPRQVHTELWPWLTAIALCLFPFDIALRRFGFSSRSSRASAQTRAQPAEAPRRTAPAPKRRPSGKQTGQPPAPAPTAQPAPAKQQAPPPPPPAPVDSTVPPPASGGTSTTSRLLAAKRRSRENDDNAK